MFWDFYKRLEKDMIEKIENVLNGYVRPKLLDHYGDIKILGFGNGILKIKMMGQCSNCPSARFTVEDVIEKEIMAHIPEIEQVIMIEGVSDELLDFAKKILNKDLK